jgi:hypothetical protein
MRMEFANASRQFAATTLVDDLLVKNRTVRYRPCGDVRVAPNSADQSAYGNVRFSIAAGVKGDLLTSRAFLHFIDLRGLMSPHGALASLRGWRAATS